MVLAALAVPAVALRAACVGASCDSVPGAPEPVPFCGLPAEVRDLLQAGYREGRSPDVLAVTTDTTTVVGPTETVNGSIPWPSGQTASTEVPVVLWSPSAEGRDLGEVTLDRVAPTIAEAIGLDRPHPEVRSGTAIPGVTLGPTPRLVLVIAWDGVGATTLEATGGWPVLQELMDEGAGSLGARTGSLPVEPAAVLTTIGTGALPRQHGVTGPLVRDDDGRIVEAVGPRAPTPVLASLGDDIRELTAGRVAMAVADPADLGVTGQGWYPDQGPAPFAVVDTQGSVEAVGAALDEGFGADGTPDLFAVTLDDRVPAMDAATAQMIADALRATDGRLMVVVAGTGAGAAGLSSAVLDEAAASSGQELIGGTVAGGWFLDQDVMRAAGRTSNDVVQAVRTATDPDGAAVTKDVFQDFSISFNRYCG